MSAPMAAFGAVAVPRHGRDAVIAGTPAALARARTFHTLDALRGVAAIVVLLFHAAFFFGIPAPAEGYLAVDLFFVMSGFIIAHRYHDDLARGMGVRRFLAVRLARLYPLFVLGTLIGVLPALAAVVVGHGDHAHWGQVASLPLAVLMLPSRLAMPHLGEVYPLNYVSWSLALEIAVNVAYAATFRIWTTRRLVMLLAVAFAALCVVAWRFGSIHVGWSWANVVGGPPRILFGFTLGLLIHRWHAARPLQARPFEPRITWWLPVLLVPALLCLDPTRFGLAWLRPAWDLGFAGLVLPAIVIAAIAVEPPKSAKGACALAGVFSYVLYSLHAPFIGLFMRGEQSLRLDPGTTSPGKAIAFALLLGVVCAVAHLGYDKPVRAWLAPRRASRRTGISRRPTIALRGW